MPWHMAAMDLLSPSLIYCIPFCYMFDFDHTDRDSSAYLAAKHCTYTLTGLYKSEVFRNTGWLTTYRMIKAGRQIINSPLNHPALPLATGNLFFYSSPDILLNQFKPKDDPPSSLSATCQQNMWRTSTLQPFCQRRAVSLPCLSHHVSPWSCVATGTPRAAQAGGQSKPIPLGARAPGQGSGSHRSCL